MLRIHDNFCDDTNEKDSAFRFYESLLDEVEMSISKLPNKISQFDIISTSLYKKK